jgi:hypothetical protein
METAQINIQTAIDDYLRGKVRSFPCHVNRISSMGEKCLRRLYYERTAWDKKAPVSPRLQAIFETGNVLEPVIERAISEIGHAAKPAFRIVGAQTTTKNDLFDKYQIAGTIDGFLQVEDIEKAKAENTKDTWFTVGVVDIKTMSPNIFPGINSMADLEKHEWTAKYKGQVMLYSRAHGYSKCFLLLVNKTALYEMKLIEFDVDMDYTNALLEKADPVNKAIKKGKPPEGINEADVCTECPFYAFCAPPIQFGTELTVEDREDLIASLDAMKEYELMHKQYEANERVRDKILENFKGINLLCGPYMITWSKGKRHYKAVEEHDTITWSKKILLTVEAGKEKGTD